MIILKRVLIACLGFLIMGLTIAVLRIIDLGIDPFNAMNLGISALTNVSFGTQNVITQLPLFTIILWKRRNLIGIGTVIGMFGVGYLVDFFYYFIFSDFVAHITLGWTIRIGILLLTLVILAIGVAIYMIANIGMVPYDAFGIVIEVLTNSKIKFKWARLFMDGICAVIALLLGSAIGITTVMIVFCMGPFISFFRNKIGVYADKKIFI